MPVINVTSILGKEKPNHVRFNEDLEVSNKNLLFGAPVKTEWEISPVKRENFTTEEVKFLKPEPRSDASTTRDDFSGKLFVNLRELERLKCLECGDELINVFVELNCANNEWVMKCHDCHAQSVKIMSLKYACELCDSTFKRKGDLTVHIKCIHEKSVFFECDKCPAKFVRKNHLNRHLRRVQTRVRPFNCPKCDKTFKYKEGLKIHSDTIHLGLNLYPKIRTSVRYSCEKCDKTFTMRNSLVRHVNEKHNKSKSYNCEKCGRSFLRKQELNGHTRVIHGQQRKFVCNLCDRTFGTFSNMKIHCMLHHYN